MTTPIQKWECPHCKRTYDTAKEATECGKWPYELLQKGDVLAWRKYRFGYVTYVQNENDWAGFIGKRNENYCRALGWNVRDHFDGHNSITYAGLICGGKEAHDSLFFHLEDAQRLVKELETRLKYAKSLLKDVQKMWDRKNNIEVIK
jgi:hypothetical protein